VKLPGINVLLAVISCVNSCKILAKVSMFPSHCSLLHKAVFFGFVQGFSLAHWASAFLPLFINQMKITVWNLACHGVVCTRLCCFPLKQCVSLSRALGILEKILQVQNEVLTIKPGDSNCLH